MVDDGVGSKRIAADVGRDLRLGKKGSMVCETAEARSGATTLSLSVCLGGIPVGGIGGAQLLVAGRRSGQRCFKERGSVRMVACTVDTVTAGIRERQDEWNEDKVWREGESNCESW